LVAPAPKESLVFSRGAHPPAAACMVSRVPSPGARVRFAGCAALAPFAVAAQFWSLWA